MHFYFLFVLTGFLAGIRIAEFQTCFSHQILEVAFMSDLNECENDDDSDCPDGKHYSSTAS